MHVAVNTRQSDGSCSLIPLHQRRPSRGAGASLLRYVFRGLLDVHSNCNLHAHRVAITTLCTEGSNGFVTSTAASVVTGETNHSGWGYLPLKSTGLSRRTAPRTLLRFLTTTGPSVTLSSSIDFLGSPVIRFPAPPISRRTRRASPVA